MAKRHIEQLIYRLKGGTRSIESQIAIVHWLWDNDHSPKSDGVKRSDIEAAIGKSLSHTVRTSLGHLVDARLVEQFLESDITYVIAEWHADTFVMGQVNEAASEGIEALITDIRDSDPTGGDRAVVADGAGTTLRGVVADRFDLQPDAVEDFLRNGDPVEILNNAVEAIQESDNHTVGDGYGPIVFRNPAYRYRLSDTGWRLYDR